MPRKFIRSINYARLGAEHVLRTQRNIWIHAGIGLLVLLAALWLKIERVEMALLVLTIVFVIVAEMLNTAIEEVVNLAKSEHHPLAALAKNVAAGAVLVAAFGSVMVGLIIFIPKIINLWK
jgi:diacylglycerol kinase (ATP)